jgi:hypothetical protein
VKRPKGEKISYKDGCHNVSSARSLVTHPTFCGQDFLDIQDPSSYTLIRKKEVLIKYVKDVIPTSKLPIVVESGKSILGDVFCYEGKTV